jgi:hypothetical protein
MIVGSASSVRKRKGTMSLRRSLFRKVTFFPETWLEWKSESRPPQPLVEVHIPYVRRFGHFGVGSMTRRWRRGGLKRMIWLDDYL